MTVCESCQQLCNGLGPFCDDCSEDPYEHEIEDLKSENRKLTHKILGLTELLDNHECQHGTTCVAKGESK